MHGSTVPLRWRYTSSVSTSRPPWSKPPPWSWHVRGNDLLQAQRATVVISWALVWRPKPGSAMPKQLCTQHVALAPRCVVLLAAVHSIVVQDVCKGSLVPYRIGNYSNDGLLRRRHHFASSPLSVALGATWSPQLVLTSNHFIGLLLFIAEVRHQQFLLPPVALRTPKNARSVSPAEVGRVL